MLNVCIKQKEASFASQDNQCLNNDNNTNNLYLISIVNWKLKISFESTLKSSFFGFVPFWWLGKMIIEIIGIVIL